MQSAVYSVNQKKRRQRNQERFLEYLSDKASYLLPTRDGFFFGGTEYDEYYFKDLEDTKDILERAIADGGHFRYGCWW